MSALKLAGIVMIVLSIVETFVMRFLIERNPNMQRIAPMLFLSTGLLGLIGIGLLLFG